MKKVSVGATGRYGLDGFDDPALQTTAGLLKLPFQTETDIGDVPPSNSALVTSVQSSS
jgi:hypothetical protein